MSFKIVRADITRFEADAIVNTANPLPTFGVGTDMAIYEAAGKEELLREREKLGEIEPGDAKPTSAFNLKAKYIFHTVGPIWEGGKNGEYDILKACYKNCLYLALALGCNSIAFPLISSGVYGFPKDKALLVAMGIIQAFLVEHKMDVTLVVFDEKSFTVSEKVVESIHEYVDANYVADVESHEYDLKHHPHGDGDIRKMWRKKDYELYMKKTGKTSSESKQEEVDQYPLKGKFEDAFEATKYSINPSLPKAIEELVADGEQTFTEKLFEYIDKSGLKDSQVYQPYISKQTFSKMRTNKHYKPSKYTALILCLALKLSIDDTVDLLSRAGLALTKSSKADLVVRACIMHEIYSVKIINARLDEFDCPPLFDIN